MCFMTPSCDLDTMITCHRYKPDPSVANADDGMVATAASKGSKELAVLLAGTPKKIYPASKGHYKVHSSFWNGTHSDTNNLF